MSPITGNPSLKDGNGDHFLFMARAYIIFHENPSSRADVAWRPKHHFFSSKRRQEASISFSG